MKNEIIAVIRLSETELDIIKDLAEGLSSQQIADKRGCAHKTIEVHRYNIFKKIGCVNVAHLIATCFRKKLIE